jgi:hypothetical protein
VPEAAAGTPLTEGAPAEFSYRSEAAGYSLSIRDLTIVIGALMAFRAEAMGDAGREFVAYPETLGRYGMSITAEDHGGHGLALRIRLDGPVPGPAEPELPPQPEGEYGRVEIPGFRNNTGWITEGFRAGAGFLVISDRDGTVLAEVAPGPNTRIVHLEVPPERPAAATLLAITGGDPDDDSYDNDPGDYDDLT